MPDCSNPVSHWQACQYFHLTHLSDEQAGSEWGVKWETEKQQERQLQAPAVSQQNSFECTLFLPVGIWLVSLTTSNFI